MGIKCKIKCDIAGSIKARLIDTRNGKVKEINKPNMLLSDYLDYYFQSSAALLSSFTFGTCYLGTGTTPPARNQTGLQGTTLASLSTKEIVKDFGVQERTPYNDVVTMPTEHTANANAVASSPDGTKVASGGTDNTVKIWDATTGNVIVNFTEHTASVNAVAFSPDGTKVASGGTDNTVKIWDATTGNVIVNFTEHTASVNAVAFSPDGTKVASGGTDNTVKIWDATTGNVIVNFTEHTDIIRSVAFSPDGTKVASGGNQYNVKVWDAATGNVIKDITAGGHYTYSVSFSSDGRLLAFGGFYNYVEIWDTTTWTRLRKLDSSTFYNVSSIAFSPRNKEIIAIGTSSGRLIIYSPYSNSTFSISTGHGFVSSLSFSADASMFAMGRNSTSVKLFKNFGPVETKEMIAKWVFDPGVGTGTINELALNSATPRWVARQVISPGIVKEDYHRLEIEWKIKVSNTPGVWSGVIPGGNRDGTDVNYKFFIGNRCFIDTVNSSSIKAFLGYKNTAYIAPGTSNTDSDPSLDFFVLGEAIDGGYVLPYEVTPAAYVPGSYERGFRLGLNSDQGNHADKLGEIILREDSSLYFGRVTFNPKLDKIPTYRLYLDFKFSLNPS